MNSKGNVMSDLIPIERIESKILVIRGQKVLLAYDLAELYGVTTKRLNEQVKRNKNRFPHDFMFQLNNKEFTNLKSQIATSSWGGRRVKPYVFTEHGALMAANVLNSERAIQVSVTVVRAFVQIRMMIKNDELTRARLDDLEDRIGTQEFQTLAVIDQLGAIKKKLASPPKSDMPKIGFKS